MRNIPLLLLVCCLSSCTASRSFIEPEVSVVNFALENATLFETTAQIEVRVDNENPFPLHVDGAVHRLYLNDTYLGKGFDRQGFHIPRLSSETHTVTIHVSNLTLLTNMRPLLEKNGLSYRIESTIHTKGNTRRTVKAADSGSFDFLGLDTLGKGTVRRYLPRTPQSKLRIDSHGEGEFFLHSPFS